MAQWWWSLVGRRFWLTSYVALLGGFLWPGEWANQAFMQALVPVFLGGILFFSGLRLPLGELLASVRDRALYSQLSWLLPLKLLAIPLVAYGLALWLLPEWATGVLLVSLMPMGLSSIAFTDLYRGHRVQAVILVVGTSLSAPLSVPAVLAGLGLAGDEGIPLWPMLERAGYILLLLFLPLLAGQLLRRWCTATVARYHDYWNGYAILCSCALIFTSVVGTNASWSRLSVSALVPALLAAVLASLVAAAGALITFYTLPRDRALAFTMGAVYMNNGLAVAFALRFFPDRPDVLLPCLLMQFPMVAATALVGSLLARANKTAANQ